MKTKFIFIIVGCGGIGGNIARDLPKLINEQDHLLLLIDGDTIEPSNTTRQPYQKQDVGHNKARALAKKINSFYDIPAYAYNQYITDREIITLINDEYQTYFPVLIGALDNDPSRKILEKTFNAISTIIYIDGANSKYEGNIYVAAKRNGRKEGTLRSDVYTLDDKDHPTEGSCEDRVSRGDTQFLITNNKIAAFILEHIHYVITYQTKVGVTNVARLETTHF